MKLFLSEVNLKFNMAVALCISHPCSTRDLDENFLSDKITLKIDVKRPYSANIKLAMGAWPSGFPLNKLLIVAAK